MGFDGSSYTRPSPVDTKPSGRCEVKGSRECTLGTQRSEYYTCLPADRLFKTLGREQLPQNTVKMNYETKRLRFVVKRRSFTQRKRSFCDVLRLDRSYLPRFKLFITSGLVTRYKKKGGKVWEGTRTSVSNRPPGRRVRTRPEARVQVGPVN